MMPQVGFEITLPDRSELPPPLATNFVTIDRIGPDVQMLVGYVDLHDVVEAIQKKRDAGKATRLGVKILSRYTMGSRAFAALKQRVDEIYGSMVESGDAPAVDEAKGIAE